MMAPLDSGPQAPDRTTSVNAVVTAAMLPDERTGTPVLQASAIAKPKSTDVVAV